MVSAVGEFDMARALIDRELDLLRRRGMSDPTKVLLGAMIEVPSLLYELDTLMPRVDFVSVGSNDLLQYLFAADRNNTRVSGALRPPVGRRPARAGRHRRSGQPPRQAAQPVRRDGRAAARGHGADRPRLPLDLDGPGLDRPVKSMVLSLDAAALQRWMAGILKSGEGSLRAQLKRFAEEQGVEI